MDNHVNDRIDALDSKVKQHDFMLVGNEDAPGALRRLSMLERLMYGKDNKGGMVQQHAIMWRSHVWVLCTASGLAGFMLRELVKVIWHV